MSTGFIALSNHGIDTTLFQPARFFHRRRRRDDLAARRLDPRQQRRGRQTEVKAHHLGPGVLDDLAHGIAKRREVHTLTMMFGLDSKLAIIAAQPIMPGTLTAGIRLRRSMTEEIDVDGVACQTPQARDECIGVLIAPGETAFTRT